MNKTLAIDNELYEECKGRIVTKAVSFAKSYRINFKDLISVGNESFCKAVATFDETCGVPFTAYLSLLIDRDMTTHLRKEITIKQQSAVHEGHTIEANRYIWARFTHVGDTTNSDPTSNILLKLPGNTDTSQRVEFNQMIEVLLRQLSREAQLVVRIFLTAPCEVLGLNGNEGPKKIKGTLRNYLRHQLKWQWKTIWGVSKEIRMALRQF